MYGDLKKFVLKLFQISILIFTATARAVTELILPGYGVLKKLKKGSCVQPNATIKPRWKPLFAKPEFYATVFFNTPTRATA